MESTSTIELPATNRLGPVRAGHLEAIKRLPTTLRRFLFWVEPRSTEGFKSFTEERFDDAFLVSNDLRFNNRNDGELGSSTTLCPAKSAPENSTIQMNPSHYKSTEFPWIQPTELVE